MLVPGKAYSASPHLFICFQLRPYLILLMVLTLTSNFSAITATSMLSRRSSNIKGISDSSNLALQFFSPALIPRGNGCVSPFRERLSVVVRAVRGDRIVGVFVFIGHSLCKRGGAVGVRQEVDPVLDRVQNFPRLVLAGSGVPVSFAPFYVQLPCQVEQPRGIRP